jgi:hypothetical protein
LRRGLSRADIVAVTPRQLFLALSISLLCLPLAAEGTGTLSQPKVAGRVIESLPLHLQLAGLKTAKAPIVLEGELVLSAFGPYRFVAAAFAHEGFAILHPYERNRQGVFVLAYPIPLNRKEDLEYRVIMDGVWTTDPANPSTREDPDTGLVLSSARVPVLSDLHLGLYKLLDEDGTTARFLFRGASGESVTVCGDFDNWDPFIHELAETSPGIYRLDLALSPGRHYYRFNYRGESLPDPLNPSKASSSDGQLVSVLNVQR